MRRVLLVLALLAGTASATLPATAEPRDLARARERDREGGKAYGEGRYADAIRAYEEAHRLGGPPFELWNIAKCHLRLDQPEQAGEYLERYLATPNLPRDDREEANRQLDALKKRPSTLTVTSTPAGASVTVDGKAAPGVTPLSLSVAPGAHTVEVSAPTGVPFTKEVIARYGRALVVEAALKGGDRSASSPDRPPPPANPYHENENPLAVRAAVAVVLPRYGSVGGGAGVGGLFSGTYRIAEIGKAGFSIGGLFSASGDHWRNESGIRSNAGCTIPSEHSATAFSLYGVGQLGFPITENVKLSGITGVGFTGLSHDALGADVFLASCDPSPGLRPAFLFGAEIDYMIGSVFRLSAFPLTWHLQPAFDGTRGAPKDATGLWMRFGVGVGLGVDL